MRKTVYEWLDANRHGADSGKKRRSKRPNLPPSPSPATSATPSAKPRNANRRKPK